MTKTGKSVHLWCQTWARIMLVLSRKKDEAIVINDNITIVVVEIRGDKVRLGIEAPREVPVHRQEVFEAIVEPATAAAVTLTATSPVTGDPEIAREQAAFTTPTSTALSEHTPSPAAPQPPRQPR